VSITTSALVSLLGGTAFKLMITYAMDQFKSWQEHKFEMARMELQDKIEEAQAMRQIKIIEAQKNFGLKTIDVEVETQNIADYQAAVASVRDPTGFKWIDAWNSTIRPGLATFCVVIWGLHLAKNGFVLGEWDLDLIGATLGIFIGSRISHTGR
jgi:hypothetical protein